MGWVQSFYIQFGATISTFLSPIPKCKKTILQFSLHCLRERNSIFGLSSQPKLMTMKKKTIQQLFYHVVCFFVLLPSLACCKNHENAANDLLKIINANRTSLKLPELSISPGLGCIALQYAEACSRNCKANGTLIGCEHREDDFTEIFAPNCGVELPTLGTISGHILGCLRRGNRLRPEDVFGDAVFGDRAAMRNGSFVQAGAGVSGGGGPWCVVFSETPRNGSFVLGGFGKGVVQKSGCYSRVDALCSGGVDGEGRRPYCYGIWMVLVLVFMLF
ncbi:uncharacterized protein LOC127263218 [Andrographis paniculata]|uniref:uncharacterized protein LOC127263218 n=1 Tax=Andrographis paniculata TaxID=175694 RepID=UPI0021E9343A|nr:uncharacterized protein LOC127263218 [Andrographis paniculata]